MRHTSPSSSSLKARESNTISPHGAPWLTLQLHAQNQSDNCINIANKLFFTQITIAESTCCNNIHFIKINHRHSLAASLNSE